MNEDLFRVRNSVLLQKSVIADSRQDEINCFQEPTDNLDEFRLSLLGKDIFPVQSAKDLGVILDPKLSFDHHITTTVCECIARLAQSSRVKHCLDKSSLLTVINALVFSKMYYLLLECLGEHGRRECTEIAGCSELCLPNRLRREEIWSCNSPPKKPVLVAR